MVRHRAWREKNDCDPARPITQGICESCAIELWREVGTPVGDFLESLGIPTLLVDGPGVVERADEGALRVVGKWWGSRMRRWAGDSPGKCSTA